MNKREKARRDRLDAEAEALFKAPAIQTCGRCFTVYEATGAQCPYCATPAGETHNDED